ncbi:MAG: PBECR2 nuclease fold domain-containing protein [Clostridium sp.]|nr:PBECR2 nuclease fold domain-containing protein [Clostridium sp.]
MHLVGRIDKDIYKCVMEDIVTDEVIITDERVRHIKERRGEEFYNTYADKFADIIRYPDYIFADKSNTALVCKEYAEDEKFINVVLRIVISSDNPEYKNSIITAVGENRKRFQQRLRNNKLLYKKG